jgi:hypothetical protein
VIKYKNSLSARALLEELGAQVPASQFLLLKRAELGSVEAFDLGLLGLLGESFVELVQRSSLNRFNEGFFSLSQLSEPC